VLDTNNQDDAFIDDPISPKALPEVACLNKFQSGTDVEMPLSSTTSAHDSLMRTISEMRDNERKERKEMEARIHSRLEVLMQMMENISDQTDIKRVRAKKTETSTATKKDHPISEVDRSIKPNDTTAMSNIKMKTCEIELHSKDDHVPDHSSHAESDSESDD
ncbi:hypothetical protein Bhyg_00724, partial [Pseudolycoriella hygida]